MAYNSNVRDYIEDNQRLGSMNESAMVQSFRRMENTLGKANLSPLRDAKKICSNQSYMDMLVEAVSIDPKSLPSNTSAYELEDVARLNTVYKNVGKMVLDESVQNIGDISPIAVNSFGIQERALISAHMPRAVKQVTAKIDNFKLTERIPYITDLAGNKQKFIDAFVPDTNDEYPSLSLRDTVAMSFLVPSTEIDLFAGSDASVQEGDEGYRPQIYGDQVFGFNSSKE